LGAPPLKKKGHGGGLTKKQIPPLQGAILVGPLQICFET